MKVMDCHAMTLVKLHQSKGLSQRTLRKLPGITNNEQLQNLNLQLEYNSFTSEFCRNNLMDSMVDCYTIFSAHDLL